MSAEKKIEIAVDDRINQPEPELVRKAKFAEHISVSIRTVDNWMAEGIIPYLKIGRTVLIPLRDALETLNRNYRLKAKENN